MSQTGSELTKDQQEEILKYCDKNQDYDFVTVAYRFSQKFSLQVTQEDVYSLYVNQELEKYTH